MRVTDSNCRCTWLMRPVWWPPYPRNYLYKNTLPWRTFDNAPTATNRACDSPEHPIVEFESSAATLSAPFTRLY